MAFPTSPTNGQVAQQNGITYTYSSATNSWSRVTTSSTSVFSIVTDTYIGDGVTFTYTLSVTPGSTDYVIVNIDGIVQQKAAYTVSSNVITFTGVPILNAVIEVRTTTGVNVGVITGVTLDTFTGNGSTVAYTLGIAPTNKNYTLVTVGGITQAKSTYTVTGTTLTFSAAPPNLAPIEVTTFGPASTSTTTIITDNSVPHPFLLMGT